MNSIIALLKLFKSRKLIMNLNKIVIFCIYLIVFYPSFIKAQNNDVQLIWKQRKVNQECRYCGEKSHTSYLDAIYFAKEEYNQLYYVALAKYKISASFKCASDKGKKFSEICDISRTGKHGLVDQQEIIEHSEYVSLEQMKQFDEDNKLKLAQKIKIEKFNISQYNSLDSFNIACNLCEKGDKLGFELMVNKYFRLMDLVTRLDSNGYVLVDKDYQIKISSVNGFGGKTAGFKFIDLERKMLLRMCHLGMFSDALSFSTSLDDRNLKALPQSSNLYSFQKIFINLGLKDFEHALESVDLYLARFGTRGEKMEKLYYLMEDLKKINNEQVDSAFKRLNSFEGFDKKTIDRFIRKLEAKYAQ